jgi:hypothetical protein
MSSVIATLAHIHIKVAGSWASVVVASLALVFTIGSFWWLNARQGKLKSFEPHSFAACVTENMLRLRFPLVFYNTGAKPIVVQDMRLRFPKEHWKLPFPWTTTRSQLKPASDDSHALPAVFSIPGRTAQQMFVEFGGPFPNVIPVGRDYRVRIEVKVGHRKKWKHLIDFTLIAAHVTDPYRYIAYSNSPHDLTEETIKDSEAALELLITRLQGRGSNNPPGPGIGPGPRA